MFFYDSNILKIGDYLRILSLKDNNILLIMKTKEKIEINGVNLAISYYDKEEVIIEGRVNFIKILYEND